jgi:hypothetical protein
MTGLVPAIHVFTFERRLELDKAVRPSPSEVDAMPIAMVSLALKEANSSHNDEEHDEGS